MSGVVIPFAPRRKAEDRRMLRVLLRSVALSVLVLWASWGIARAQSPPTGTAVLNQGVAARLLTKSDTAKITITRGLYIGDASACTVVLLFNNDTAAVTMTNLQSGATYPFAVVQLQSTGTTCASVFALY